MVSDWMACCGFISKHFKSLATHMATCHCFKRHFVLCELQHLGKKGFFTETVLGRNGINLTLFVLTPRGAAKYCTAMHSIGTEWEFYITVQALMWMWQQWSKQTSARPLQLKQVVLREKAERQGRFMAREWHSGLQLKFQLGLWPLPQ